MGTSTVPRSKGNTSMRLTRDGKQRRSESEWQALVSRLQQSGLSLREFAKQESICEASLQRWHRRLSSKPTVSQAEFVDVTPRSTEADTWRAEIEFPGGVIFRLRG